MKEKQSLNTHRAPLLVVKNYICHRPTCIHDTRSFFKGTNHSRNTVTNSHWQL